MAKKRNIDEKLENAKELKEWQERTYTLKDLPELLNAINSSDKLQQHFGAIGIRCLLSQGEDFAIQKVIDANVVPHLIRFAERSEDPQLQYEAVFALTNIASGTHEQTQSIIDKGGITALVRLLKHKNLDVSEKAIWCLGNMAAEDVGWRDQILKFNVIRPLMEMIEKSENVQVVKNGTWAL